MSIPVPKSQVKKRYTFWGGLFGLIFASVAVPLLIVVLPPDPDIVQRAVLWLFMGTAVGALLGFTIAVFAEDDSE